jgi:thiamine biosynthesis lipoprotein
MGFLALLLALLAPALVSCNTPTTPPLARFEFTEPQMGVPFRIVLYAPDASAAKTAAKAAFDRISQLNNILSDYEFDSELSTLSRTAGEGRAVKVSPELWYMLTTAQAMSRRSDGAFDITVGPYVSLWRKARRDRKLPDSQKLERARAAVGYQYLRLDATHRTAELLRPGMRLDLGSIAKGYAIDEALKTLRRQGIRSALVAGSGDIGVSDPPPGRKGWRIEVAPLDSPDAPPARHVVLANRAITTSGDLFQNLEIEGVRYSHIVNPKTGLGMTDHSLVSVIALTATTANSLSTTVNVVGPQRGLNLVRATAGAEVRIARKPASAIEVTESPGFAKYYESASAPSNPRP